MSTRQRLFSDTYDSVAQRGLRMLFEYPHGSTAPYLGMMRFDLLLSRCLVLTDAQLLDGTFFRYEDPETLLRKLRRRQDEPAPIEIRGRSSDLERCLIGFVRRADETIPFRFSSLRDDDERTSVQEVLRRSGGSQLTSVGSLEPILRDAGVSEYKQLVDSWKRWSTIVERGQLNVCQWQGIAPFRSFFNAKENVRDQLTTEAGHDFIDWIYKDRTPERYRAAVESELEIRRTQLAADYYLIKTWYYAQYNNALASQHLCDQYQPAYSGNLFSPDLRVRIAKALPRRAVKNVSQVADSIWEIPELSRLLELLSELQTDEFWKLFAEGNRNFSFEKWWATGDPDSLKAAMSPFVRQATQRGLPGVPLPVTIVATGFGAVAGGIAAIHAGPLATAVSALAGTTTARLASGGLRWSTLRIRQKTMTRRVLDISGANEGL